MRPETKRNVKRYAMTHILIYGISLLFSLLSLIFIVDKIPSWVQFLVSFVFMAPVFYMSFMRGKEQGERIFKENAKTTLDNLHSEEAIVLPYRKCIFHVLYYVIPLFIVTILTVTVRKTALRLIVFALTFPVVLLFSSVGAYDTKTCSPVLAAFVLPYVLLVAGTFVLGYILQIVRSKRRHAAIENEIRMFDN